MKPGARYAWLVLAVAALVVVSMFEAAPQLQQLELRLGSDHGLSSVQLTCETGGHSSGARWNLQTRSAPTHLSHEFRGSQGEYNCEVVLHSAHKRRQVQRKISLSGDKVTLPLEHELAKLKL